MSKLLIPEIEFNIVSHCNLNCKDCSHLSPYNDVEFSDLESFKRDIDAVAACVNVNKFQFVGGEPLLHKKIIDYIKYVKNKGFIKSLNVITNGVLLSRMTDEFFQLVSFIGVSAYPDVLEINKIKELLNSKKLLNKSLKTVISLKPLMREMNRLSPSNDEETKKTFDDCLIAHAWHCHIIHKGRYYKCSRPIYTNNWLEHNGIEKSNFDDDGIAIHEPNFKDRLVAYLNNETPFLACKWCFGTSGTMRKHEKL